VITLHAELQKTLAGGELDDIAALVTKVNYTHNNRVVLRNLTDKIM
jgi:hypothetical protein